MENYLLIARVQRISGFRWKTKSLRALCPTGDDGIAHEGLGMRLVTLSSRCIGQFLHQGIILALVKDDVLKPVRARHALKRFILKQNLFIKLNYIIIIKKQTIYLAEQPFSLKARFNQKAAIKKSRCYIKRLY